MTRLRPAAPADIPHLQRWDQQPHVLAVMGEDEKEDWAALLGDLPADWEVLIIEAEEGGQTRPIGVLQTLDPVTEPEGYWRPWFDAQGLAPAPQTLRAIDIWIGEAEALGQGRGTQAMRQACTRCFAVPTVEAVLIDPLARNRDAIRFYRRLGFVEIGPFRFGEDDCMILRLDRAVFAA